MIKKVLILGSNGFIGSYVYARLSHNPEFDVYTGKRYGIDLLNIHSFIDAFNLIKPNIIINIAGISDLDQHSISRVYGANAFSIIKILEFLQKVKFEGRFINTSSSLVYNSDNNLPHRESDAMNPRHHYSCAKAMVDNAFAIMGDELDLIGARPFNCFGKGQSSKYVVPKLVQHFKSKESIIRLGSIDHKRDFVDVRDISRMYEALCYDRPVNGNLVNFCSGIGTSVREMIESLKRLTGHSIEILEQKSLQRKNDKYDSVGDSSILLSLGFRHKYNTSQSLRWMLDDNR
jgi:nucleoside-diphosphate-sugar epimerase